MTKKLRYLCTLLLCMIASVGWAERYKLTISPSDFNKTSYAANNNEKTSNAVSISDETKTYEVKWTSYQVMLASDHMQWQKDKGYIYNSTDLGSIISVNVNQSNDENNPFTIYYGSSKQPTTSITVGGGYFQVKVGNTTGSTQTIEVIFEISDNEVATTTTIDASGITNTDVYTSKDAGSLSAIVTANNEAISGATIIWSSSDEGVATIDANGAVTLVAAGTTTITATYAGVEDQYQASYATYELTVTDNTPFNGVIFNATEDIGTSPIVKDNVSFACSNGVLNNGSEYRLYKNSTTTISTTDGSLITKIEFTGVNGYAVSNFTTQTGWTTSGNNGVWTGEAESVSFVASGAQVRATEIKVTVVENANPSINANNVEILYDATSGSINYSIEKPVNGGALTANTEDTWLTLGDVTADAVLFTTSENEVFTARTASIVLTYTYGESSIDKTITLTQAGNPNVPGTSSNPFTVAQANEFISSLDNNVNSEEVYVKGIISGIKSIDVSKYERAQYYISDNGNSTGQLLVYNGYYIGGVKFTANDQIQVGDNVVVYGSLVNYNETYEVAQNNKLISLNRPEKPEAGLEYKTTEVTAMRGEAFTAPKLTNPYDVDVTYSSSNEAVATVDAEGAVTLLKAGNTIITASFAGNADYKEGSASYTLTVTVPSHTATFFVNGTQQGEPIDIAEDDPITFPTPDQEILGKTFVGWTTSAFNGEQPTAPETLVKAATMGTANVEFYAVYAIKDGEDAFGSYTLDYSAETALANSTEWGSSYGTAYNYTATDGGVWTVKAYKNNGMQINTGKNASIKVPECSGTITSIEITGSTEKAVGFSASDYSGNGSITYLAEGTDAKSQTLDLSDQSVTTGYIVPKSGSISITKIIVNYTASSATYSGYCTTVVAPVKPAKPIVFHDGGEGVTYEGELIVPMFAEEGATIYYTTDDTEPTAASTEYTEPLNISTNTTFKAIAVKNGVPSDVVTREYTIVPKAKGAVVEDGYYTIQTNDDKYVNVAGRKTVTLVSDTKSAGTVIRVKADEDGVKVLRSQAVDLPRYAERAMSYVPELVKEVVKKLAANVDDPIIGEQGADLILDKFNKEFDYHLYLEGENNTYRIYGRTPSMKPVVDFYAENKELVDSRLPKLEGFVEEILLKVAERLQHPDSDWAKKFKVHNIWALIVNEENKLTEPVDEASTAKFFTEVLSSEANIWNFAHETAMIYWDKVKSYLNDNISELGDYGKYIEKIPQIRPNFKYYIVPSASGVDIISEGNSEIKNASTAWKLAKRDGFDVTFDATLSKNNGKEMYKTLYVDFAYELPENVKAYAITGINETTGFATKEEISGVIAAQTPVLLQATFDAEQTADQTMTLTLSTKAGTTPETNLLVGADYLINEYEINTPQVESIFSMLAKLSQSLANEYSYLKRKNAGTVNNKYFFGIAVEGELDKAYKEKTGDDMENTPVRILSMGNQKLGFYGSWDPVKNNEAFIVTENEELDPVKLTLKGDVDRDGDVDEDDLKALVEIVLGKVTLENNQKNYDFDAAYVNDDEDINIADVTALVNILKPQPQD